MSRTLADVRGVLPALVTPLRPDGEVDEPGVTRLVRHTLSGGVHGLVPLGSTGETASLTERMRRSMLSACLAEAGGQVPVICGVAQPNLAGVLVEVAAAADLGVDGLLVAPPFYYPIDQPTVLDFYRRVAAASPVPVLVYNIPQFTKVTVEPMTLARLAEEGAVVGIKDSSRDFEYFERVCLAVQGRPDFRLFTGSDWMLLASLAMGGVGTICGAANVAPAWVVRVWDEFMAGRWTEARQAALALVELMIALRIGVFPSAIKAALEMQGICDSRTVTPVAPLAEELREPLRRRLEEWGLVERSPVPTG